MPPQYTSAQMEAEQSVNLYFDVMVCVMWIDLFVVSGSLRSLLICQAVSKVHRYTFTCSESL